MNVTSIRQYISGTFSESLQKAVRKVPGILP